MLAVLVLAMAGTGLMALRAGALESSWVFTMHGLLAGALLAAVAWKLRRSIRPAFAAGRWRSLAVALLVAVLVVATLTGGFLWVAAGRSLVVGTWTVLTLHAWLGLPLLPLLVLHLLPRRWRLLRPGTVGATSRRLSRRSFVAMGGLAVAGLGAFASARLIELARGGEHRFTGSRWLPSGGVPPATTFYGEGPPSIDPDAWRLTVIGADGQRRSLGLADLEALGTLEQSAVLDCTSGWALETTWRGVPLPAVLGAAGAAPLAGRGMRVTSVTGWTTVLSLDEARAALLATGVAGHPLPSANGAPCRLVVPGRRGLDWVKWVGEVRPA
jgi:DMSO/TMAO reductase YedYZ molybdopterin-dependent catalytic subunit